MQAGQQSNEQKAWIGTPSRGIPGRTGAYPEITYCLARWRTPRRRRHRHLFELLKRERKDQEGQAGKITRILTGRENACASISKHHLPVFAEAELMHKVWARHFILRNRSPWRKRSKRHLLECREADGGVFHDTLELETTSISINNGIDKYVVYSDKKILHSTVTECWRKPWYGWILHTEYWVKEVAY